MIARLFACMLLLALAFGAPALAADLTYVAHPPTMASPHPPLIVLLHGSGADERDMISLWPDLPQDFVVVSLRAPFADRSGGYRWYRKTGGPTGRDADIALSRKIIDVVVANCLERFGADPKRVFIAGFSQGAVMAYAVALREPDRFRGAAVLSGTLFPSELAKLSATTDWAHESLFIAHGTADRRIPFASATAAHAALSKLGVPTVFHAYPGLGHGTDNAEIRDLSAWLTQRAAPVAPAAVR